MAYSNLVSLERTIDQILNHSQILNSPHEKEQIKPLREYVTSFQHFLEDFPEKAKNLEARIRDVATEAEDAIEWFMTEKIRYSFRCSDWIAELRRITFKFQLRKVRDQMDSIAGEMLMMKKSMKKKDPSGASSSLSSSPIADAGKANYMDDESSKDLAKLLDWLCGNSKKLQSLPITGMGGIGKTTLARNAYEHSCTVEHFHIRAWVTVSQDYDEARLLSELMGCFKEFDQERRSNKPMAQRVYQLLVGRRFLIVMDDMWSTKVLDDVKKLFPDNNNGSRILLTTRLADVAAQANSSAENPHEVCLMDEDQSWNLLRQKVLGRHDSIPPELEATGREIARSCGGLPLATVVVAGALSTVGKTLSSWTEFAHNVKSSLSTTDGQVLKILRLSYNHLPHHLRACFLYMGGFPEDHEIKAMDLIRLWIAEGFVKQTASKSLEETAEKYMEDLIERSLIMVSKSVSTTKFKHCRLHDLVRDLCIKVSREEKFLVHVEGWRSMKGERRISVSRSDLVSFANIFSPTIRTMLYFQNKLVSFGSFVLLRVLDALRVKFRSHFVPDQFFELFHLRYLAFNYPSKIPRAISNLQNLQTLIIGGRFAIHLPQEIWYMPQLRHLRSCNTRHHFHLPPPGPGGGATPALINLQTLGRVMNFMLSPNMIPNIRKLSLTYNLSRGRVLLYNLVHFPRLEKLKIKLEGPSHPSAPVPRLVLPSSLKKLAVVGWGHNEPYLDIVGPFPNLEVLKLRTFHFLEQEWTTGEKDFLKLRFLLISGSNLKEWNTEGSHFPVLERLMIHSCWSLSGIPDDMGEIATLKLIEVANCDMSLANSIRQIQEEQKEYDAGDNVFQVRCIEC